MAVTERESRQIRRRLLEAIWNKNPDQFKKRLTEAGEEKINLNADYLVGSNDTVTFHTYLQSSVSVGCPEILDYILDLGAAVNSANRHGVTPLHEACSVNSLTLVKALLKRGADPNAASDTGRTPLMVACIHYNLDIVRELLDANADIDYTDCHGDSALHLLLGYDKEPESYSNVSKVADCLARHGCDVNQTNRFKETPLMLAAQRGNTDVMQTLILAGCQLDCVDSKKRTALYSAIDQRHVNSFRLLIQNGANMNLTDFKKVTPLMLAVEQQNIAIVDLILSTTQGLSTINMADYEGITPIFRLISFACIFGAAALHSVPGFLSNTLLSKGCDVNIPENSCGWTSLFTAAKTGNTVLAQLLLAHGAKASIVDKVGETVLHAAIRDRVSVSMLSLLLRSGCDVNIQNQSGHTALFKSVVTCQPTQIVEMLIDAGTDLEAADFVSKESALHVAVYVSADLAILLISRGCNINHADALGNTPLAKAIRLGRSNVVNRLLSLPYCDVNTGATSVPLHEAVSKTDEHLIGQLVSLGADINKTNQNGERPIQLAVDANSKRIIRCLLKLGCSLDSTESSQLVVPKKCCRMYHDAHPHVELQPLFASVKYDDLNMFKLLLSHYYRKPYSLLRVIHDMLTVNLDTGGAQGRMLSIGGREQLIELLRLELITPSPLLALCRGTVRQCLGVGVTHKVASLHLPSRLKSYLMFQTDKQLDLSDLDISR